MRLGIKTAVALALTAIAAAGQANAADIYRDSGGVSLKDEPLPVSSSTYYFAIRGGATFAEDTDFDFDPLTGGLGLENVENQYEDMGFFVSGAIGMSLASMTGVSGLRGELEAGYLQNDIDAHVLNFADETSAKISGSDAFGETSAIFGLVNLYYDFNQFGGFKPFIGAGLGIAQVEFDRHGVTLDGLGDVVALDDEDTGFAYQLSAGANIAVSDSVDIEIGYRYLGITEVELEAVDGTASDVDVDNHIVYGGLRFKM